MIGQLKALSRPPIGKSSISPRNSRSFCPVRISQTMMTTSFPSGPPGALKDTR